MKQTAVEWLANSIINLEERLRLKEINLNDFIEEKDLLVEQAKAMEKEQMKALYTMHMVDTRTMELYDFDEYYNETFKSE